MARTLCTNQQPTQAIPEQEVIGGLGRKNSEWFGRTGHESWWWQYMLDPIPLSWHGLALWLSSNLNQQKSCCGTKETHCYRLTPHGLQRCKNTYLSQAIWLPLHHSMDFIGDTAFYRLMGAESGCMCTKEVNFNIYWEEAHLYSSFQNSMKIESLLFKERKWKYRFPIEKHVWSETSETHFDYRKVPHSNICNGWTMSIATWHFQLPSMNDSKSVWWGNQRGEAAEKCHLSVLLWVCVFISLYLWSSQSILP